LGGIASKFVSTADTIGGNSGSPILNRAGEFVGINFDCNRHGLVRNFVYTEEQARHISVHSRGILEALRKLYNCPELAKELVGGG
jgi:V8-like Glu-specific endopeptidase